MASIVRMARNLFSSSLYSHLLKDRPFAQPATKTIQNAVSRSLSVVRNNITQNFRSERQLFFTSATSLFKSYNFRNRRLPVTKARGAYATHNTAVELALNSVVKVFTVSCSPNYLLPWQNKSQRETMGSGQFILVYEEVCPNSPIIVGGNFYFINRDLNLKLESQ